MPKRKQKLEVKIEEPLLVTEIGTLMEEEGTSPSQDWFLDQEPSFDFSHSVFSEDLLDLLDIPLSTFEDNLENDNKEVFQDLQYTSTPKSRLPPILNDSGIDSFSPKRRRTESTGSSSSVLNDITNNINGHHNNFSENLILPDGNSSSPSKDFQFKRRVGILRKSLISKSYSKGKKKVNVISKDQMIYYTGIQDYNKAVIILKHIKLPKSCISFFKMQLMTLMKLRLDLEWKDISFRYGIPKENVMKIVQSTINIMSVSLEAFLPWNMTNIIHRKRNKAFYVHVIKNEGFSQVIMVFDETEDTILFVSESFDIGNSPIMILLNQCNDNIILGDLICVSDGSKEDQLYRVENMLNGKGVVLIDSTLVDDTYYFVDVCRKTVEKLFKEFILLTKPSSLFFDISSLAKVAGAFTNLNRMDEINITQLKTIHDLSSQCI